MNHNAPENSLTVAAPWWGDMPNCGMTCGFGTSTSLFEQGEVTGWPSLCNTYHSIFLSNGPPKATQNAHSCTVITSPNWTSRLGDWVESHTGKTPCPTPLHPYTPTPPTMPSYSRCASIKSSEDPSWKRLQTSSRNPVSSGQWMDLANFQSHIMRSRLCKVLNCRNCIPWPSTSVSNIELGDEMNRDRHHNNLDAVSTRTWKEWTCQVVFSVWHLAGNLIKA